MSSVAPIPPQADVRDALYRYCEALDAGRRREWLDCFTTDGVWEVRRRDGSTFMRFRGMEELAGYFDELMATVPSGTQKHLTLNARVEIAGETAVASSYFVTVVGRDGAPVLGAAGEYVDRLVRGGDGVWRFEERLVFSGPPDLIPDAGPA